MILWPRTKRILLIVIFVAMFIASGVIYIFGTSLTEAAMRMIGSPPQDFNAVDVQFAGVKGWYVPAYDDAPCILLMHGVRSDRRSMIKRARLLQNAGYSALLFDFQAHGESPGEHITFGYRESLNSKAAVGFMRSQLNCTKIAAIGQSMGGAAALVGVGPIEVDALVLESTYTSIDNAVADRLKLRFGDVGALLAPLLTLQLKPRLGIDTRALRPIDSLKSFHNPVMIMSGTNDKRTPIEDARRLYAAANSPKEFWAVPGAAHVDLQRFAPVAYKRQLLAFLQRYLKGVPAPN